ncbi:MAG: DUF2834 domain-containing protein [Mycobacteriaceae bacterium]
MKPPLGSLAPWARARVLLYSVIAVLSLWLTVSSTWGAYSGDNFFDTSILFWKAAFSLPASKSISFDIIFTSISIMIWMFIESRILKIRGLAIYFLSLAVIAMAVVLPAFLIHREFSLSKTNTDT